MTLGDDDIRFLTAARQFLDRAHITGHEARVLVAVSDWLERAIATLGNPAQGGLNAGTPVAASSTPSA